MAVAASTLSEAIARLTKLGYVRREKNAKDRRAAALTLTDKAANAMAATSVLDSERVRSMLELLNEPDRKRALEGMKLLAEAAGKLAARVATGRSRKN
jgi:DNA-binding MarR family transcriptional regulator